MTIHVQLQVQVRHYVTLAIICHEHQSKLKYILSREDKGNREGIPHTYPIP